MKQPAESPDQANVTVPKREAKEIILHYKPTYVAEGGGHIVYAIPNHPQFVVKVHKKSIDKTQAYLAQKGITTPDQELLDAATQRIRAESERREELGRYFSAEHVLKQRTFFAQVPLPSAKSEKEMRGIDEKLGWALVRVQDKLPVDSVEQQSIRTGYAEQKRVAPLNEEQYWRVTEALVSGESCDAAELSEVQRRLVPTLKQIEADPAFRERTKDFVVRTVTYAMETQNSLDLAGEDNTVMQKDAAGNWNYLLVDAFEETDHLLRKAMVVIEKISQGEEVDRGDMNRVLNAINFVRGINGLAVAAGVPQRITLLSSISSLSQEKKAVLLKQLQEN